MYRPILLLFSAFCLNFLSCKEKNPLECNIENGRDDRLTIHNNSASTIYYSLDYYNSSSLNHNPSNSGDGYAVYPNSTTKFKSKICIEHLFDGVIENDTLIIFFYDRHLVDSSWQYVRDNNLWLERRKITLPELEQQGWQVKYPL